MRVVGAALLLVGLAAAFAAVLPAPGRDVPPPRAPGGEGPADSDTLPMPVLLVPGWSDDAVELRPLRNRFLSAGWPEDRVLVVEFRDPVGSNREHARELGEALGRLLESTGSSEADVVAHSMGGLALRYHLARRGHGGVRRVVLLGTPNLGTVAAHLAWGEGGDEMEPGSPFLDSLNALPPVPRGVEALAVRTPLDLRVIPGESALLPGNGNVRNAEVCCPTHPGLVDDPEVFEVVVGFLREGELAGSRADVAEGRRPG